MEKLIIAGKEFGSRLFLGTGKFNSNEMMEKAYAEGKFTDWESLMFSPAIMQRYNLGVRGGVKNSR